MPSPAMPPAPSDSCDVSLWVGAFSGKVDSGFPSENATNTNTKSGFASFDLDPQPAHQLLDRGDLGGEARAELFRRAADDLVAGAVRLLARLRRLQRRLDFPRQQRDDLRRRSGRREQRVERVRDESGIA